MDLHGWMTFLRSRITASSALGGAYVLNAGDLETLAECLSDDYAHAEPFPHAVIDDFLPTRVGKRLRRDFPPVESDIWIEQHPARQPGKLGITHASRLRGIEPSIVHAVCQFNSFPFLNFLSRLTGISKLLPDPYLHGGGPQQVVDGGRLDIHTDFTHLAKLDLYRRINVLYYLSPPWRPEYGGELEFWTDSRPQAGPVKSIAPAFNRMVVFNTTSSTFHGHPKPLRVPKGVTRKALAFYYYTAQPDESQQHTQRTRWIGPNAADRRLERP